MKASVRRDNVGYRPPTGVNLLVLYACRLQTLLLVIALWGSIYLHQKTTDSALEMSTMFLHSWRYDDPTPPPCGCFTPQRFKLYSPPNSRTIITRISKACTIHDGTRSASILTERSFSLQVKGLDAQTDCMGHLTHAVFSRETDTPQHPKTYGADDVNATLIR